ncbi:MAG: DNA polymerase III subunit beta [Candidatus Bipolaricaulota bacterium]|nr:DNA polymerase III subunit beta [Candidatus Bipolaricaulota bacterium]MCS7275011.1 DNA polymerase III subunit beta [Candidatus Bipolaricaulota bacterium]MDW8110524.1 DNA polymerase III subunit beta [Candidatus Bipolaricaulota bacterium]MDW8329325.1 DNA polymerase III subunit beta [Candidatus Bipolaricaulota bacterium]
MEFSCGRDEFLFGVKIAGRALGRATSMPILAGMKLETKKNQLTLAATDLERSIWCSVPIENRGGDEALVLNGELLAKIAQNLPADTLHLKTVEGTGKVEIRCGSALFDLFRLPLEDYPELPVLPSKRLCLLESRKLARGLELVTFAALSAKETSRLSLTGVNLVLEKDTLKIVATNGYRLACKTETLPKKAEGQGEFLVAADSLRDLAGILAQVEAEHVEVYQSENYLFFKMGSIVFVGRLIEEAYPDFEKVIPRDNAIGLILERKGFLEALQRAQITAAEESDAVILSVEDGKLTISSQAAEKGEAQEVLDLKKRAPAIKISFRAEYLIDALKRLQSEEVRLWLADAESAGLLEPGESEADQGFLYVCMPIRMDF